MKIQFRNHIFLMMLFLTQLALGGESNDSTKPVIHIDGVTQFETAAPTYIVSGTVDSQQSIVDVTAISNQFPQQNFTVNFTANGDFKTQAIDLNSGMNLLTIQVVDQQGNENIAQLIITRVPDQAPPVVLVYDEIWYSTHEHTAQIEGKVKDDSAISSVVVTSDRFASQSFTLTLDANNEFISQQIPLIEGLNTLTVEAVDQYNNKGTTIVQITQLVDSTPPELIIDGNLNNGDEEDVSTEALSTQLKGHVQDESRIVSIFAQSDQFPEQTFQVNLSDNGDFTTDTINLYPDNNLLSVTVVDEFANQTTEQIRYTRLIDREPPTIVIDGNATRTVNETNLPLTGSITDQSLITDTYAVSTAFAGQRFKVDLDASGHYTTANIPIADDLNQIFIVATDEQGNQGTQQIDITLVPDPEAPKVKIDKPHYPYTEFATSDLSGTINATKNLDNVFATNEQFPGQTYPIEIKNRGHFETSIPLKEGFNNIVILALDEDSHLGHARVVIVKKHDEQPPVISLDEFALRTYELTTHLTGDIQDESTIISVFAINDQFPDQQFPVTLVDHHYETSEIPLKISQNLITIKAVDQYLNEGTQILAIKRVLDDIKPVIQLDGETTITTEKAHLKFSGTATDNTAITSINITNNQYPSQTFFITLQDDGHFETTDIPLNVGENILLITATDKFSNKNTLQINVTRQADSNPPQIEIDGGNPREISTHTTQLSGKVTDDSPINILYAVSTTFPGQHFKVNIDDNGFFNTELIPIDGTLNQIYIVAVDQFGNESTQSVDIRLIVDHNSPVVLFDKPHYPTTESTTTDLSGTITTDSELQSIKAYNDRKPEETYNVSVDDQKHFSTTLPLSDGYNNILIIATDVNGLSGSDYVVINKKHDEQGPVIQVDEYLLLTYDTATHFTGTVNDESQITTINASSDQYPGQTFSVNLNATGHFDTSQIPLKIGQNIITIVAIDQFSNRGSQITAVKRLLDDTEPKIQISDETILETEAAKISLEGTVTDNTQIMSMAVTNNQYPGQNFPVDYNNDGTFNSALIPLSIGENQLEISATDQFSNRGTYAVTITRLNDTHGPNILIDGANPLNTQVSTLHVTGTITDSSTISEVFAATAQFPNQHYVVNLLSNHTFTTQELPLTMGMNEIFVVATDEYGNQSTEKLVVNRTLDDGNPIIIVNEQFPLETQADQLIVTGTATDTQGIATLTATSDQLPNQSFDIPVSNSGDFTLNIELKQGANHISLTAIDTLGNSTVLNLLVNKKDDHEGPAVQIEGDNPREIYQALINLSGTVQDQHQIVSIFAHNDQFPNVHFSITVNTDSSFISSAIPLKLGNNTLSIEAMDEFSNITTQQILVKRVADAGAPVIIIDGADPIQSEAANIHISGHVTNDKAIVTLEAISDRLAGQVFPLNVDSENKFSVDINLLEGNNNVQFKAIDSESHVGFGRVLVIKQLDHQGPDISIAGETQRESFHDSIVLSGTVSDANQITTIHATNDQFSNQIYQIDRAIDGSFVSLAIPLKAGDNLITISAKDEFDNESSQQVTVKRLIDTDAPVVIIDGENPRTVQQTNIQLSGNITETNKLTEVFALNNLYPGQSFNITLTDSGHYTTADIPLKMGSNHITIHAVDEAGNLGDATVDVVLPPQVIIDTPESLVTQDSKIQLQGSVSHWSEIATTQLINDQFSQQVINLTLDTNGHFNAENIHLKMGNNLITVTATANNGVIGQAQITILREADDKPPHVVIEGTDPRSTRENTVQLVGNAVDRQGIQTITGTNDRFSGQIFTVDFDPNNAVEGHFTANFPVKDGDNHLTITAIDATGNIENASVLVVKRVDSTAPDVHIDGQETRSTSELTIRLTGSASDDTAITKIVATNNQFPDQEFGVNLTTSGIFSADVALKQGDNIIIVSAQDAANHKTQAQILVTQNVVVETKVTINAPTDQQTVNHEHINLSGAVQTEYTLNEISLSLNGGTSINLEALDKNNYQFQLKDIVLSQGANSLRVDLTTPTGTESDEVTVYYQPDQEIAKPLITIDEPLSGSVIENNDFIVSGDVYSESTIDALTINGENAHLTPTSNSQSHFNFALSFNNQAEITLTLVALDNHGQQSVETLTYKRDNLAPEISLVGNPAEAPSVNNVIELPYPLAGTVIDNNLSSLTLNDQPITLTPGSQENHYDFTVNVGLQNQQATNLELKAYDQAGNVTTKKYQFYADIQTSIEIIAPSGHTEFNVEGNSFDLQVIARVNGLQNGETVHALVDNAYPTDIPVQDTLANAVIPMNATSGEHQLKLQILDANSQVVSVTQQTFKLLNDADVPLSLVSSEPRNGAQNVEPNASLKLFFNKTIDKSKLSVQMNETFHGETYVNLDESGAQTSESQGYVMQTVHRDNEAISGNLSALPGENLFAFYPQRDLAYTGYITVNVSYDGHELGRFAFNVRPLPTFVQGTVFDQFGQTVEGVEVTLADTERTSITNGDGLFSFGYGDNADKALKGGRYQLIINPNLKNAQFGKTIRNISIEQGVNNKLGMSYLPLLNVETPFQSIASSQSEVSLAQNELTLDLTHAQLTFPNHVSQGNVQVLYLEAGQANLSFLNEAAPIWYYGVQPAGIQVSGSIGVKINIPKLYNSYAYVPENGKLVVLLGRGANADVFVPVGVGKIEGYQVQSITELAMPSLDFIAYAFVSEDKQALLQRYVDHEISLDLLTGSLQ